MTLQTFIIPLVGVLLGKKYGTHSSLLYLLLGVVGAPVFAGFTGGLHIVLGPTGGFLLSFPLLAFTAGIGAERDKGGWLLFWLVSGAGLNYLCGMLVFQIVTASSLGTAFTACVLPFIPTAASKILLVTMVSIPIKKALLRMQTSA